MAQQSQVTQADRKAELVAELAWSRAELARNVHDARSDLNVVAHLKHSFEQRKTVWITGAAITGWILSRLPGRRKKQPPVHALHERDFPGSSGRAAFWLAILGALVNLFKPLLTALASRKINELAARSGGGWRKSAR